jgi:hypothetical protein
MAGARRRAIASQLPPLAALTRFVNTTEKDYVNRLLKILRVAS